MSSFWTLRLFKNLANFRLVLSEFVYIVVFFVMYKHNHPFLSSSISPRHMVFSSC